MTKVSQNQNVLLDMFWRKYQLRFLLLVVALHVSSYDWHTELLWLFSLILWDS